MPLSILFRNRYCLYIDIILFIYKQLLLIDKTTDHIRINVILRSIISVHRYCFQIYSVHISILLSNRYHIYPDKTYSRASKFHYKQRLERNLLFLKSDCLEREDKMLPRKSKYFKGIQKENFRSYLDLLYLKNTYFTLGANKEPKKIIISFFFRGLGGGLNYQSYFHIYFYLNFFQFL